MRTLKEMGRELIIGHTITTHFQPDCCDELGRANIYQNEYMIGMDCGCARSDERSCLGVLRLEDGMEWYF